MAKSFYGIIGWPLLQTFSPDYFHKKFAVLGVDADYLKFPLENIDTLPRLLQANPDLRGLNVTIPHKTSVMPYLDAFSEDAKAMGAVNCIDIRDGKLTGHNTDWYGFLHSLQPLLKPHHKQALILGSGGASKAIAYALRKKEIDYRFVSRVGDSNALKYTELTEARMRQFTLIINTTPLGMIPNEEKAPDIPYQFLTPQHLLFDIVYTASGYTPFLSRGKEKGATIKDGLEMLHLQAEKSWEIWCRL